MIVKRFENRRSFSCNLYVVSIDKTNFIVDPGYFDEEIEKYISSIGGISFVLITHGHFDHIGGIDLIKEKYPNVNFYANEKESKVIYSEKYNCSKDMHIPYIPSIYIDYFLEGINEIEGIKFEVISTPGHTIGSVIFYFDKEKVLFTGDTIIGPSIGRSDLPTGKDVDLYNSLSKIKERKFDDQVMVYSGHDNSYNYGTLKRYNPYL